MVTSFARTYASMLRLPGPSCSIPLTLQQATVSARLCWRLLDTHRQVWLSLLWVHCSLLMGTRFFCALQESVSPVLWKFCNQSPLAFKLPSDSQSLCQILRLGNLLWAPELMQEGKNFFDIIGIGTWNVRSMNQGKSEVVKQEMARMNIDILGISELRWTGMGEFNADDHYIYYCGQESLRRNRVSIIVNKRV